MLVIPKTVITISGRTVDNPLMTGWIISGHGIIRPDGEFFYLTASDAYAILNGAGVLNGVAVTGLQFVHHGGTTRPLLVPEGSADHTSAVENTKRQSRIEKLIPGHQYRDENLNTFIYLGKIHKRTFSPVKIGPMTFRDTVAKHARMYLSVVMNSRVPAVEDMGYKGLPDLSRAGRWEKGWADSIYSYEPIPPEGELKAVPHRDTLEFIPQDGRYNFRHGVGVYYSIDPTTMEIHVANSWPFIRGSDAVSLVMDFTTHIAEVNCNR